MIIDIESFINTGFTLSSLSWEYVNCDSLTLQHIKDFDSFMKQDKYCVHQNVKHPQPAPSCPLW